jgi:hypothetical protein
MKPKHGNYKFSYQFFWLEWIKNAVNADYF